MSDPEPDAQEFAPAWWAKFADRWNAANDRASLSSRVVFVLHVDNVAGVRCEFREDGHCSLGAVLVNEGVPTFSGTVENWRSVLGGHLGVEKAVLSGFIDYVGPMSFLAEHWDLLRSVVANGAQLVGTSAAVPVLTPTDVMIHSDYPGEIIAILRAHLGMKVEARENSWTGLVHPETQQRFVITGEPLPLGSWALGSQVQDIEVALAAVTAEVPPNQVRIVRADGYAHVLLYGSLSLLLYGSN